MKTVELVFFDFGGGHRSAANALSEVARHEGRAWTVRMTNLRDLVPALDFSRRFAGIDLGEVYNAALRRGWAIGAPGLLRAMHAAIRWSHEMLVTDIERCWRASRPDLVVSLIPHFNRALYDATRRLRSPVPFVTILTDLSDYPPHFWIERGQDQYVVCGTPRAREQALAAGHPAGRVVQTSGMILNPGFYEPVGPGPAHGFAASGLDPAVPTALVMFGGAGSAVMPAIASRLDASGLAVQLIAVCGRNEGLEASMNALSHRMPMHVTGFTHDVARLMRQADFFIGKPGPGSISEAVAMGLPVIVECNRRTLPQERYNAAWVEECGFGVTVRDFRRDIVGAVGVMLDPSRRAQFGERVKAYRNRAVFEITGILETILSG